MNIILVMTEHNVRSSPIRNKGLKSRDPSYLQNGAAKARFPRPWVALCCLVLDW